MECKKHNILNMRHGAVELLAECEGQEWHAVAGDDRSNNGHRRPPNATIVHGAIFHRYPGSLLTGAFLFVDAIGSSGVTQYEGVILWGEGEAEETRGRAVRVEVDDLFFIMAWYY